MFSSVSSLRISWAEGDTFLYLIACDEFSSVNFFSSSVERGSEQLLLLHLLPLVILRTHDCFHSPQTAVGEYSAAKHLIFCIKSVLPSYWVLARATPDRGMRLWVVKIYQGWSSLFSIRWRGDKWCQYGQVGIKRQNGSKNDCCVRNAWPNHCGLGAGKWADEAELIPVWLESLTDAIPSWEWHNTWYCFALWEAMFANSTSIPLSTSVIVCWFCYREIPMKVKKGCASSISQEREGWRVLNQPLCPVVS